MTETITSLQNQRVKNAVKLRERRGREKSCRTIIDGAREIQRAVHGQVELVELFVCRERCTTVESDDAVRSANQVGAEIIEVASAVFEKLAFGDRAEGVVAVAKIPVRALSDLPAANLPLVAVLEGVEKPGNIGAMIRSADGAGVSSIIVADGGTDLYNPNTIRASLGLIFSMPVVSVSSAEAKSWLDRQGIRMIATQIDGEANYWDVDLTYPTAIVLGSEASGLSDAWQGDHVTSVNLPMLGTGDSLNVSAAAAVLFYEAQRQRSSVNPLL